jgi:hypothetical protein
MRRRTLTGAKKIVTVTLRIDHLERVSPSLSPASQTQTAFDCVRLRVACSWLRASTRFDIG